MTTVDAEWRKVERDWPVAVGRVTEERGGSRTGSAIDAALKSDVTAPVLQETVARHSVQAARLAPWMTMNGELEYLDAGTLTPAFARRAPY